MKKKKQKKIRSIEEGKRKAAGMAKATRNRASGLHINKKKKKDKEACRGNNNDQPN